MRPFRAGVDLHISNVRGRRRGHGSRLHGATPGGLNLLPALPLLLGTVPASNAAPQSTPKCPKLSVADVVDSAYPRLGQEWRPAGEAGLEAGLRPSSTPCTSSVPAADVADVEEVDTCAEWSYYMEVYQGEKTSDV